ncbi:YnfU family zinc-binding protein [Pantoea sp. FN0302]|uniref:YnfU family zinc-binding protein n=2 Tax=Pantoea TaxID=53335 RepID=UPI003CF81E45
MMTHFQWLLNLIKRRESGVQCPVCKRFSNQTALKRSVGHTMLCPHCKSLFAGKR